MHTVVSFKSVDLMGIKHGSSWIMHFRPHVQFHASASVTSFLLKTASGRLHLPGLAASLRGECAQVQRMRWAGMAKYHKGLFHMAIRVFFKDLNDHWSKVKREIGAKHFYKPCGNRTIILKIIALVTFYQQQPQVTVFVCYVL